jgi:Kef-type K+ transport system membrane component KefB
MTHCPYGSFKSVCAARIPDLQHVLIVCAVLIIALTQLIGLVFARIRQPRVIAEVIGGVLLGPSVFGRIPGLHHPGNIYHD